MIEYSHQGYAVQALTGICGARILLAVTIGANIKRLREAAKLTQTALGHAAKVKQSDISKWENGQTLTIESLVRLAAALGVGVDAFLAGFNDSYDAVRGRSERAGTAHPPHTTENNSDDLSRVTSSVQRTGVLDQPLPTTAEETNAESASGGGPPDSLSQSQASHDAEMREIGDIDRLVTLIKRLDQSVGSIQSVASALRAHLRPAAPRTGKSSRAHHRADLRLPKARRGSKR